MEPADPRILTINGGLSNGKTLTSPRVESSSRKDRYFMVTAWPWRYCWPHWSKTFFS